MKFLFLVPLVLAASNVSEQIKRFAPVTLTAEISKLSPGDQKALGKIIAAAKELDPLYLRQVWSGNPALKAKLDANKTVAGKAIAHLFRINVGPWSRLDHGAPFVDGVPAKKPLGAGYYPEDMTKEEFEAWEKSLPPARKEAATGFFTKIERKDGKLQEVPYSDAYRPFLAPAAKRLKEAAELTTNATLKKFLSSRAEAFTSNDYYASDVAWMEIDAPLDITIGPYETYEDELFGYKAAFEAYVCLRNEKETQKLSKFSGYLQELENNLPMDPKYRNPKIGAIAPIRVVDLVFSSGDGRKDIMTAAFNLPNDEKVVKEKGSKRVMLKNVQEAKFKKVLLPISQTVLSKADQKLVAFEPFFTHILMHELMHGLGPNESRKALKDQFSAIEEAKADITGLWAMQYLMNKKAIDPKMQKSMYVTYLASSFRSVRFGITEAHGKGVALQFNYLMKEGAFRVNGSTFEVDEGKIQPAVAKLAQEILTIEAEGSYDRAKTLLDQYARLGPQMQRALESLKAIPTDIEPHYPLAVR